MRFPLRLTLDLWRGRMANALAGGGERELIFHLPADVLPALHHESHAASYDGTHSAADSVRTAAQSAAPVLWIGGTEPLGHSEVGRVTFALNAKGRNVFLHTDGRQLRRRIHEFRPDPRLFLTLEFAGHSGIQNKEAEEFRRAIEGIRAAKLSGFYVCAHVTVGEQTDGCATGELFEYLDKFDVDGFIVSSKGRAAGQSSSALSEKLDEIRELVRCNRWESFSRLLEASYTAREEGSQARLSAVPQAERKSQGVEETV